MQNPISCEFYDQLMVAIQRKIPSTIVYLEGEQNKSIKGIVTTLSVIEEKEFLILNGKQKISLHSIFSFNGKKHKEV
ncbi:MAG: transcriptional antiterminator Rof [Campylobacteraceae bacterium]|nr:transcriptional antiterminator Rof [Campylobacteraceae bacterium]